MRFTIVEINNSTVLLPNVKLGYEILDHCSPIYNFPGVLDLISFNGSIRFSWEASDYRPLGKVMGVIGASSSSDSLAIAPLFTLKLIPLVNISTSNWYLAIYVLSLGKINCLRTRPTDGFEYTYVRKQF